MTRFPNHRPARLAGVDECLARAHRRAGVNPSWALFGKTLAMGAVAFLAGAVCTIVVWRLCS